MDNYITAGHHEYIVGVNTYLVRFVKISNNVVDIWITCNNVSLMLECGVKTSTLPVLFAYLDMCDLFGDSTQHYIDMKMIFGLPIIRSMSIERGRFKFPDYTLCVFG